MTININPNVSSNNMPYQDVEHFRNLIGRNAISCTWEQAMRCPCIDPISQSPNPTCPICHGQGWLYREPYLLDIAMYSDEKNMTLGSQGNYNLMGTTATPQISSTGIENGIKPGDRITVNDWYNPQEYLFNVTKQRLNKGVFLPYDVSSIDVAYVINNDQLQKLAVPDDISLNGNYLSVNNNNLINETISLVLSVVKRFYVVTMLHDFRYLQILWHDQKSAATGDGNTFLTYKQLANGDFSPTTQVFKMAPQFLLRRETLYFSSTNLVNSETDNNYVISDPKVSEMNDFLGG